MKQRVLEFGPPVRRAILLTLAAGVPLFFLRFTNDAFGVPKLALLMIGVSLVSAIRGIELIQGASPQGLKRLLFPALAFSLPLVVSWVASPYRGWALFGLYPRFLGLVPYLVIVLYGVLVADAFPGRASQLAWAVVISGAVMGGYGALQVLGIDPFAWNTSGGGSSFAIATLGNSNFVGTYLAMTFPFFLALWLEVPEQRRRLLWMFPLALAGWAVSLSEAAWISGIAGTAVVLAWVVSSRWSWARWVGLGAAGAAAVFLVGIVLVTNEPGSSITYRGWWWGAAMDMAAESPIVGRGPAAFAVDGIRYRPLEDALNFNYSFPDDPHSVFMALLTAAGVLGVAGLIAVVVWAVRKGLSISPTQVVPAAFFASVIAYIVNSLTTIDDVNLRVGLWTGLGGLAASLAVVDRNKSGSTRAPKRKVTSQSKKRQKGARRAPGAESLASMPAVIIVALLGLAGMILAVRFVIADARVRHGEQLFLQNRVDEATKEFDRAIGFRGDYAYRQLYGLYLGDEATDRKASGDPFIEKMDHVFSFVDGFPYVPALADYGAKLYAWGEFDQTSYESALVVYERARRFDPLNPLLRVQTADVLIALDRYEDAIGLLDPFVEETGDRIPDIWGALALAYFHAGDLASAQEAMERALSINPAEARALETRGLLEKRSSSQS